MIGENYRAILANEGRASLFKGVIPRYTKSRMHNDDGTDDG